MFRKHYNQYNTYCADSAVALNDQYGIYLPRCITVAVNDQYGTYCSADSADASVLVHVQ